MPKTGQGDILSTATDKPKTKLLWPLTPAKTAVLIKTE